MAEFKPILTIDDENNQVIYNRCDEIDVLKEGVLLRTIVGELKKRIRANNLVALSAPAIGYNKRVFCVNFNDSEIKTFINPVLSSAKGITLSKESCTSIPNKEFIRPRNTDISIMYQKPLGQIESRQVVGVAAFVIQHEMDHLDGILLNDVGLEVEEGYEDLSDDEKAEIIDMYLDSLDMKRKALQDDLNSREDTKRISEGIRFMEEVAAGRVEMQKEETDS